MVTSMMNITFQWLSPMLGLIFVLNVPLHLQHSVFFLLYMFDMTMSFCVSVFLSSWPLTSLQANFALIF